MQIAITGWWREPDGWEFQPAVTLTAETLEQALAAIVEWCEQDLRRDRLAGWPRPSLYDIEIDGLFGARYRPTSTDDEVLRLSARLVRALAAPLIVRAA